MTVLACGRLMRLWLVDWLPAPHDNTYLSTCLTGLLANSAAVAAIAVTVVAIVAPNDANALI